MRVLIIGGGGREHALAWRLSQSPRVDQLFVAPGNGGTGTLPKVENVELEAGNLEALRDFAMAQQVDLTMVGPEAPLVNGIVDLMQGAGLRVVGPTQIAAQLEGSKAFSKQFMLRYGIPTGQAEIFDDFDDAIRYLRVVDDTPVIKASGLAAGKGVLLPADKIDAAIILRNVMLENRFGTAGSTVLLEERLAGPELSVLAFTDGKTARLMPGAQDHKRLLNNDQGPNTGGMGAFAPSPLATRELMAQIEQEVILPTLSGMAADGIPYVGVLYAGIMLTAQGPKVLEFNCRLGDPETQALLPLLESDLSEVLLACAEGTLDKVKLRWRGGASTTVVMASGGYPDEYLTGVEITGIEDAEALGCHVFHAGTKIRNGRLLTDGGRVLAVTGTGKSVRGAAVQAYRGVARIRYNGAQYRNDIGGKAG
jgi:phosphoribosylamine---glycine ligase